MSDEGPDNLALRYLRNMDAKLDRVLDELADLKRRVSAVEEGQAAMRRDMAGFYEMLVRMQHAFDRLGERVDRLERRADLIPGD